MFLKTGEKTRSVSKLGGGGVGVAGVASGGLICSRETLVDL